MAVERAPVGGVGGGRVAGEGHPPPARRRGEGPRFVGEVDRHHGPRTRPRCVPRRRRRRPGAAGPGRRGPAPGCRGAAGAAGGTGGRSTRRRPPGWRRCGRRRRAARAATGRRRPSRGRARLPGDRRPAAVAEPGGVDHPLGRDDGVLQAQLLAGVEERRAPQPEQQHRRGARRRLAAQPGAVPGDVVAGEHPGRPRPPPVVGLAHGRQVGPPLLGLPRQVERQEVERQVQLVAVGQLGVGGDDPGVGASPGAPGGRRRRSPPRRRRGCRPRPPPPARRGTRRARRGCRGGRRGCARGRSGCRTRA